MRGEAKQLGERAADQPEKEHEGNGREGGEEQLHRLGEQDKADQPAERKGNENRAVFLDGLPRVGEQLHHRLIDTEGHAQHTAADPGQNGADAD